MILDIITATIVGGGSAAITFAGSSIFYKHKKPKLRLNKDGSMPWSFRIRNKDYESQSGVMCFKCSNLNRGFNTTSGHPKLCHCLEYFEDHFHFKCNCCGYSNILRTADHE